MKKVFGYLVSILLWSFVVAVPSVMSDEEIKPDDVTMAVRPCYDGFIPGEPIKFALVLDNLSAKSIRLRLGCEGVDENLRLTLVRGTETNSLAPVLPGGFREYSHVVIPAHDSAIHYIYLDEVLRLREAGVYTLYVRIEGAGFLSAMTEFKIRSLENSCLDQLETRYLDICKKLLSSRSTIQERKDARRTIVLSTYVQILELQKTMLRLWDWENDLEYERLIDSLVLSRSPQAMKLLVQYVLENPKVSGFQRAILLNRLRVAGVESWNDAIYEMLSPYMEEIIAAQPVSIDD